MLALNLIGVMLRCFSGIDENTDCAAGIRDELHSYLRLRAEVDVSHVAVLRRGATPLHVPTDVCSEDVKFKVIPMKIVVLVAVTFLTGCATLSGSSNLARANYSRTPCGSTGVLMCDVNPGFAHCDARSPRSCDCECVSLRAYDFLRRN